MNAAGRPFDAVRVWTHRWHGVPPVVLATAAAAVLAALVVAGWLLTAALTTTPSATVHDRLNLIADGLRADPEVTIVELPGDAVGTFDGATDGVLSGTVGIADRDGSCVGLAVSVGQRWVLAGDRDAIEVSEVQELDPTRCERSG